MTDYSKLAGQTVDGWYYLLPDETIREGDKYLSHYDGQWIHIRPRSGEDWRRKVKLELYRNDVEFEVEIKGHWIPERRATLLDPAEGGYFEDITAEDDDGNEVELTDKEIEKANEMLCDEQADRFCDARAERGLPSPSSKTSTGILGRILDNATPRIGSDF